MKRLKKEGKLQDQEEYDCFLHVKVLTHVRAIQVLLHHFILPSVQFLEVSALHFN